MTENKESLIIDAAYSVFLRYGFKRVTMNDIAEAAGISRPAVYLIFTGKEDVFKAVFKRIKSQSFEEIKNGLPHHTFVKDKLRYAFELWTIKPYEAILRSPDANELINCAFEFANDVIQEYGAAFEALLASIIEPAINERRKKIAPDKLAHLLRGAVNGFKELSQTSDELRQLTSDLIDIVITAKLTPVSL